MPHRTASPVENFQQEGGEEKFPAVHRKYRYREDKGNSKGDETGWTRGGKKNVRGRKVRLAGCGCIYASSTAGLFYFMNRNISRDNWTRGAATAKLSAYGGRAYYTIAEPYRVASHRYHSRLTQKETRANNARHGWRHQYIRARRMRCNVALFLEKGGERKREREILALSFLPFEGVAVRGDP